MDKLHRLIFCHRRVNLCSFRTMKVPTKKLLFPLLNEFQKNVLADIIRHLGCVCIVMCVALFASCSTSNEEPVADGKNVYRASYYQLELPEGFSVDSSESNSGWNVRYIKDSFDNRIMSFYDGESTNHGKTINKKCKKNGFMTFARLDSMSLFHGALSVHRTVVIYANRSTSIISKPTPLFVEFNYRPDLVDSAICEKIIRSAKVRK